MCGCAFSTLALRTARNPHHKLLQDTEECWQKNGQARDTGMGKKESPLRQSIANHPFAHFAELQPKDSYQIDKGLMLTWLKPSATDILAMR